MKLLIIGIDGADERIMKSVNPKFFEIFNNQYHSKILTEDLWSRGWSHMFTGKKAWDTGGAYMKPKLDGTYDFTQSFSLNDINNDDSIIPIWEIVNNVGKKVGIMNVPGTRPAPKVNGFFISGAGAGIGKINSIRDELYFPASIKKEIKKSNYVFDIRLTTYGSYQPNKFFSDLEKMIKNRCKTFLKLSYKNNIDFGFIAIQGLARAQYLAMNEIDKIMQPSKSLNKDAIYQKLIINLFHTLNREINELLNKISPENYIITSDHGMSPYLYKANMNPILRDLGFLPKKNNFKKNIFNIKSLLPRSLKLGLRNFSTFEKLRIHTKFDPKKTLAFGHRYINGVYLNDKRFGSSLVNKNNREQISKKFCEYFNSHSNSIKYNMNAVVFREKYLGKKFETILPDIWINKPDNIFFEGEGDFIENNIDYEKKIKSNNATRDMLTGIKGRHPLFICNKELKNYFNNDDFEDLRLVHQIVERMYSL
tara:strand:+ start:742 stop:2178 length:1437 start_codon:yes stop_codon:yes gene_type:complete